VLHVESNVKVCLANTSASPGSDPEAVRKAFKPLVKDLKASVEQRLSRRMREVVNGDTASSRHWEADYRGMTGTLTGIEERALDALRGVDRRRR
jgi:hypothetical protein